MQLGELWLMMSGIIFLATITQVLTGFGFGLVAVPLLLFVLPSQQALLAVTLLSMMSSSLQVVRMRHLARWDIIIRLLLYGIPGLMVGVFLSGYFNELYIKGIVGVILIIYVLYQWMHLDLRTQEATPSGGSNGLGASSKELIIAALASGLLNGLAAIPGPPVVALLIKHLPKEVFQGTAVNFFFLQYGITAISKMVVFRDSFNTAFAGLLGSMILAIMLGYLIGMPIRKRINEVQFKKLVYGLLLTIGLTSIGEPIFKLLLHS